MKHLTCVLVASVGLATAGAASAQSGDASAPASGSGTTTAAQARTQAQGLVKDGVALLTKKDFAGALDKFQRAYAVFPSPKVLIDVAAALKGLGRSAEAANTYQKWLDDPGAESSKRDEITKVLAQLDRSLGVVTIATVPADAEVQVDGWQPGWLPPGGDTAWLPAAQVSQWRVMPGPFTVRARKTDFITGQYTGSVNAGGTAAMTLTLAEAKKPDPVVEVKTPPPVEVATHTEPVVTKENEHPAGQPTTVKNVQLGAVVDVAIDGKGKGAAVSPGISVRLMDRFEVIGKAQISASAGGYLGALVHLTRGRFRPMIGAGVPVFFSNGARIGLRGAVGLDAEIAAHVSGVIEVGAEYFVNPEMNRYGFVIVPVVGVHGRL